jgi:drug/metabolite transporter (DMT)-like permease
MTASALPYPRRDNIRGGLTMLVAVGALSLLDAGMKSLAAAYPPLQLAGMRGLASLPFVLVWVGLTGGFGGLLRVRWTLHLLRGVLGILMLCGFVYGVRHLPLSEAYSIFFVAPLLITAFAVPLLGERVGWRRWVAILIGVAAVWLVLRPQGTAMVLLPALAVFLAAVGYALSAITVRVLGRTDSSQSMVFWLMLSIGVVSTLLALPQWKPIQPEHWPVIAWIAVSGALGQWAITEAFRLGEASFIAPFEYTAMAWGVGLDWLLWQTVPAGRTWIAAAVIIACGIYLMHRERVESTMRLADAAYPDPLNQTGMTYDAAGSRKARGQ